jgi:hypothetical protein
MDGVTCPNGHALPDDFHYGVDGREPCPICGSTARAFHRSAFEYAGVSDWAMATITAKSGFSAEGAGAAITIRAQTSLGWSDPPAADQVEVLETYKVILTRLLDKPAVRFVTVVDGGGNFVGAQVCDSPDDVGITVGVVIAEDLQPE